MIGRAREPTKQQPAVPRHPIDGTEDLAPAEIRKLYDEIVQAAGTSSLQHFNNDIFCRHVDDCHGVGTPIGWGAPVRPHSAQNARERDLGNILVSGRNYMRGHVQTRRQVAASVALGHLQALVRRAAVNRDVYCLTEFLGSLLNSANYPSYRASSPLQVSTSQGPAGCTRP